ncbi:hypothetical protein BB560_001101 [Smittium megazygosporum]|uniref:Protein YIP n=1 Tax=Smittium megazygosporum TaxID=133381 RepID=A0A2T9ZIL3_9FUNG|nr:hypothetical protein BB560_001101 [Smittium megazygosporum]
MESKDTYNIVVDVDDTPLDFQADFAGNSALNNHVLNDYTAPQPPVQTAESLSSNSIWELNFWAQYFNIDTNQVFRRCYLSLTFDKDFLEDISVNYNGPDLWGPFWIPTTVVYSIFVTTILSLSIAVAFGSEVKTDFSFLTLSSALSIVYLYVFLVPIAVGFGMKYLGTPCSLIDVLVIYGYSTTVWVFVSILCMLPYAIVRWLAVLAGFAISGLFIFRNISMISQRSNSPLNSVIAISIILLNIIFSISLKFSFFSYSLSI